MLLLNVSMHNQQKVRRDIQCVQALRFFDECRAGTLLCPLCQQRWITQVDGGRVFLCACGFRLNAQVCCLLGFRLNAQSMVHTSLTKHSSTPPTYSTMESHYSTYKRNSPPVSTPTKSTATSPPHMQCKPSSVSTCSGSTAVLAACKRW
jgi:hypothetical protein